MIITDFQMINKFSRVGFFQETLVLSETNMEVILRMSFLSLSMANFQYTEKNLFGGFTL